MKALNKLLLLEGLYKPCQNTFVKITKKELAEDPHVEQFEEDSSKGT